MPKSITLLKVHFDNLLPPKLVPAFRGAIIEKVKRSHILFHHHVGEKSVLYQYPLIQYKSIKNKPSIVSLGEGAHELHRLMNQPNLSISIHNKLIKLEVEEIQMKRFELKIKPKLISYCISNWLGLNEHNFKRFKSIPNDLEKVALLERILIGNILAFAKGVEWQIEQEIKLEIMEVTQQRIIRFKGKPLVAFNLIFRSNTVLPDFLGLGKSTSHGYGMIKKINNN